MVGALSALGAAYAGERLRTTGARKVILDTLEDRLAYTIGVRLLRR